MTDPRTLLERHRPRLVYDAQEEYFADSAAIWTDSPTNVLRRADGTPIAKPPTLSLDYLGTYQAQRGDVIGDTKRDYEETAAKLHANPRYANRVYGHARRDRNGKLWLQYWLFYYYNHFRILGSLVSGGKHEGDWELIQIELDEDERPLRAVLSQHREAEVQPWSEVRTHGPRPLIYIARGSHANYFGAGTHWTGHWVDRADGKGPRIDPTLEIVETDKPKWLLWPGRWGDTTAGGPVDANSPTSPGSRRHWKDPLELIERATPTKKAPQTPAPTAKVTRAADKHVVRFEAPPEATELVVATRPRGTGAPAQVNTFKIDRTNGQVEVPAQSDDDEVWTSAVAPGQGASETV
ncbi:hypothetical protein DVA67_009510 [Solirubrobacter sp. CPCC 204708]|uniref:Uncharacterized protein n=1 Tax=Solirubrobacter deserti TaxID=2282478 RepID=A0ABT4RTX3_9ACTN|nr:hypothetical protein [Solirubrobacter deserti]MBE2316212.1 hypothetical protein [Solirubrobacter deserti]MDA0141838.1 hypothetical protein [Solirubrobacter deserti]